MERRAMAVHLSYYPEEDGARERGEADYWCRFYNRDSSHMTALSSIYKAFLAGVTLSEGQDYGRGSSEAQLSEPMAEWLADPQNREAAARAEHDRWLYFMCTRGWRRASVGQMRSYLMMGNPRQQLYLAKLHPCIVSWQELPEVQRQYNAIQRQRNPKWRDRDLIQSDYGIVDALPGLLCT